MALATQKNHDLGKEQIKLISEGNHQSFRELYDFYHARMFHFALKYLRSNNLAEEAVQDIFLKIWEKREELPRIDDFSSWVFQLTKNHLLNILKRAINENRIKEEISRTLNPPDSFGEDSFIEKEAIDMLYEVVATLPAQRKEIFKLCRFEQKSYDEVALIMGISKSTVNDHMVKAMKHLKNNFPKNSYR